MGTLTVVVLVLLALTVGVAFGWKWVLAPLLGALIIRAGTGLLRSMAAGGPAPPPAPEPVRAGERVRYHCGECGAELLLLVRGTAAPPRHCGERMHERTEIPHGES